MDQPDALAAACAAAYRTAVARLDARALVRAALAEAPPPPGPVRLAALGKAAGPMLLAALEVLGDRARRTGWARPCTGPAGTAKRSP